MHVVVSAVAAGALLALAGCQSSSAGVAGTIAGAVGGGARLTGGLAGSAIGQTLNGTERRAALDAEYRALEFGRAGASTPWSNAATGHYGSVVPGASYRLNDTTCREYNHTIVIDGRTETAGGSACRTADGGWQTVG